MYIFESWAGVPFVRKYQDALYNIHVVVCTRWRKNRARIEWRMGALVGLRRSLLPMGDDGRWDPAEGEGLYRLPPPNALCGGRRATCVAGVRLGTGRATHFMPTQTLDDSPPPSTEMACVCFAYEGFGESASKRAKRAPRIQIVLKYFVLASAVAERREGGFFRVRSGSLAFA
jgi:hypothetical protein